MHHIYYLFDAQGQLLYIGRSTHPQRRKTAFERKHSIECFMGPTQRYSNLDRACEAERVAIIKHRPPFNKLIASAKGHLGHTRSDATKDRHRQLVTGQKRTAEQKHKLSLSKMGNTATLGHHHTAATKQKLSQMFKGKVVSPETRLRMSQAATGRRLSESTKKKLSDLYQGRSFSDETRARISAGVKAAKLRRMQCSTQL